MSHWNLPIQLTPIYQKRVWGGRSLESLFDRTLPEDDTPFGESWEVSDRDEAMCRVMTPDGELGETLRELWSNHRREVFGEAGVRIGGTRFPLLVKILDCQKDLSIQVHPPTEVAAEFGGEPKTEMWYIAHAEPGAKLYVGLRDGVCQEEFEAAIADGNTADLVHTLEPKKGDFLFIESGRLHAIGGGFVIYEIQQNSDTTYRVFDWNRVGLNGQPRDLHIRESLASIDFNDHEPELDQADGETLVRCEHFDIDRWVLKPGSGRMCLEEGQFCVLVVTEGKIFFGGERLGPGDFRIVPAAMTASGRPIVVSGEGATVLVTTLPAVTEVITGAVDKQEAAA